MLSQTTCPCLVPLSVTKHFYVHFIFNQGHIKNELDPGVLMVWEMYPPEWDESHSFLLQTESTSYLCRQPGYNIAADKARFSPKKH